MTAEDRTVDKWSTEHTENWIGKKNGEATDYGNTDREEGSTEHTENTELRKESTERKTGQ